MEEYNRGTSFWYPPSNNNNDHNNDGGQTQMVMNSFCYQSSDHETVKTEGSNNNVFRFHHHPLLMRAQDQHKDTVSSSDEAMKAKILAHPQYSNLLEAYMDCQKIGAPPEVVARLTAAWQEFESRQRSRDSTTHPRDPELDQFMEAYYDMLVKYREELTRPIQEAMDFMRKIEAQLSMLTNTSTRIFNSEHIEEKCEESSEEEAELDPRAEYQQLKKQLVKKYSGYLSSLKQELSKKTKKGKLPKEARQKLLAWWELHYKWPYPSETEKVALAESTGLDQKQINNWFINQRKRHWKPSEDMHFMLMDPQIPHFMPHHPPFRVGQ